MENLAHSYRVYNYTDSNKNSASSRKKQQISLESVTSLRAGNETVTSATGTPGAEEPKLKHNTVEPLFSGHPWD